MKPPLLPMPEGTRERIRLAREAFDRTMEGPVVEVEMRLVNGGDAIECFDGVWRPVLGSFAESAASASPTIWVLGAYADWDRAPTQRLAGNPSAPTLIRRRVA